MFRLLEFIFPPKLGRIERYANSVTLYNIDAGILHVIEPDYAWAGNVKEWSDSDVRLLPSASGLKTRRPIERFSISYENESKKIMMGELKPFSWELQMREKERELNDCGIVTA